MSIKKTPILYNLFFVIGLLFSIFYIQNKMSQVKEQDYRNEVSRVNIYIKNLIKNHQKSSMAIAITLADSINIKELKNPKKFPSFQKKLYLISEQLRKNNNYKKFWIQIVDNRGISLVRSWTQKHNDSLLKARKDIVEMIKNPRQFSNITVGKFSTAFKAMIPIYDKNNHYIASLEISTHFDSLIKELKTIGFETTLLVDKKYKKNLTHSLTKFFIDDYYVANKNFNRHILSFIKTVGIEYILSLKSYIIANNNLLIVYHIHDIYGEEMDYLILTKNKNLLNFQSLKFFVQSLKYILSTILLLLVTLILFLYYQRQSTEKQKLYFKNILDSTSDIIIISNIDKIIDVNRSFFNFFSNYKNLNDFKNDQGDSISALFIEEEGFVSNHTNNMLWINYIIQHAKTLHKIKINYHKKTYCFYIQVKALNEPQSDLYTIVLTNITQLEEYKNQLEYVSKTDALTKIGNRHYFKKEIDKIFYQALDGDFYLSIVMLDIDYFKKVNDTYGHDIGDKVLIKLSQEINKRIEKSDIFCRYGGEEFIILMPQCSMDRATLKSQEIRKYIETMPISPIKIITMSFGVTQLIKGDTIDTFLKRVDEALYQSKKNGRNCVTAI